MFHQINIYFWDTEMCLSNMSVPHLIFFMGNFSSKEKLSFLLFFRMRCLSKSIEFALLIDYDSLRLFIHRVSHNLKIFFLSSNYSVRV